MRTGLRSSIRIVDSLGFRVAALLSVALLPLGIISMMQNVRTISEAERLTNTALAGRTAEAAAAERALMLTAFGAAEGLAESILSLREDNAACRAMLANFVSQSGNIVFAGFTPPNGVQRCSSNGEIIDVTKNAGFQRMDQLRAPFVAALAVGRHTGGPVVTIRWPVRQGETYLGYLVLSMPNDAIAAVRASGTANGPQILTFNQFGEVLTSDGPGGDDQAARMPQDQGLLELARDSDQTFRGLNQRGEPRVFTVVPVIPGQVYAMGSWAPQDTRLSGGRGLALLYPLLMWLASLGVAYFAVHRLVIRHIRTMRGQMRRFALGEREEPPEVLTDAPPEIQDVSQTFHNLARILIRDEKELEASVEEKTVLLKEVHHRVKNNLQLIASIMNMQIRRVREPSARAVLKSVQDRVMSLATVHRSLYTADRLSAVPVDELLSEICEQMMVLGAEPEQPIDVATRFAPVTLYPDQAVPLALLATEAVTNAMKYIGHPEAGPPWIRVTLAAEVPGRAVFMVENSAGPLLEPDVAPGTGLGGQLMQAFVTQLDGSLEAGAEADGVYRLRVDFPISGLLEPEPQGAGPRSAP